MADFHIGDRPIGPEEPTFVIAEAGSNHNGDLNTAKELIDVAAAAGADAVKFQTFRAEELYVEESGEVEYLDDERPIYDIIEDMEMPYDWIPKLHEYCRESGIYFMSTPFDERSVDELAEFVPAWKVASYTSSHHPFLRSLTETEKPIVMSTGVHELPEIREAVDVLRNAGAGKLVLLQCVAAYPTPLEEINVRAVRTLMNEFDTLSGLSDHTLDPVVAPTAAVALGASVVEKHITLDKGMEGPDHEFALEPDELNTMISAIRQTESALGTGSIERSDVETELYEKARRAIHATTDIEKGATLTEANVKILRPGERESGLDPKYYYEILGETAARDISPNDGIQWEDIDE